MSEEHDLDLAIQFGPEFQADSVGQAELSLLASILPEVLKEVLQLETEQE